MVHEVEINDEILEFPDEMSDEEIKMALKKYPSSSSNKSRKPEGMIFDIADFIDKVPEGAGNAFIGANQTLTSALAPESDYLKRLTSKISKRKENQSKYTGGEKAGLSGGKILTDILFNPAKGLGAIAGGAVSSFTGGLTDMLTEDSIKARLKHAGNKGEEGGIFGAGLNLLSNSVGKIAKIPGVSNALSKIPGALSELPLGDDIQNFFKKGKEYLTTKAAKNELAQGLKREKIIPEELLDKLNKNKTNIIDELEPNLGTYQKGVKSLDQKSTIDIANLSTKKATEEFNKLEKDVLNSISRNQISPEEGGQFLGQTASNLINEAKKARKINVDSLYKEGLKGKAPLKTIALEKLSPEDAEMLDLKPGTTSLTLEDILESPKIKEAINTARNKSKEYSKSPGALYYGNLHKKSDMENLGVINSQLKTAPEFKVKPNELEVLGAVRNIIKDKIGHPDLKGATTEQGALIAIKKGLENIINKSNPALMKAHEVWGEESKKVSNLVNSGIGRLAKQFESGNVEGLAKNATNVLNLPTNTIEQLRAKNPSKFNDLLRNSLENRVETAKIGQDFIKKGSLEKIIFGKDNGETLKTAINNPEVFNGFKKLISNIENLNQRTSIASKAGENVSKKVLGGNSFIDIATKLFPLDKLVNSTQAKKKLVSYLFTDEGKNILTKMSKASKKDQKMLTNMIIFNLANALTDLQE